MQLKAMSELFLFVRIWNVATWRGTHGLKSNRANRQLILASRSSEPTKFLSCELRSALLTKEHFSDLVPLLTTDSWASPVLNYDLISQTLAKITIVGFNSVAIKFRSADHGC